MNTSTTTLVKPSGIFPPASDILAHYFDPVQVQQMLSDSAPIVRAYGGLNVFSTSQYGRRFILGTSSIKDIFDARIPGNFEIFKKYAFDNFGIRLAYFERYAEAANKFMADFEYDAVLFHPDELHPVLTDPVNDTWMLLRDAPTNTFDIYYSSRVLERSIGIAGGLKLRSITPSDPLYTANWMFYIPVNNEYQPYATVIDTAIIDTVTIDTVIRETVTPVDQTDPIIPGGPRLTIGPSNYVPRDASDEAIAYRRNYGIIDCPLSNRTVRVGGWKDENYAVDMVANGISFRNNPISSTWGGWGLYLLVLDQNFWIDPAFKEKDSFNN